MGGSGKTAKTVAEGPFLSAPQARLDEASNADSAYRPLFDAARAERVPEPRNEPISRDSNARVAGDPFGGSPNGGRAGAPGTGTQR